MGVQLYTFICVYPVVPKFVEKIFPPWNCLSTCAKNLFIDPICIAQFYLIDLYVYLNASTTLHSLL